METESITRQQRIDGQLGKAGWTPNTRHLVEEYLLKGGSDAKNEGEEFADYALLNRLKQPIAIVEVSAAAAARSSGPT